MAIDRQNIIDLIGKNKNKYSSCIILSYTFDFTYFEERILPALRTSNIRNVNVFVDGNYLDNLLENNTSVSFNSHRSYSLNSIYSKGVFHPKIMLLTGPKHGLLILGSGNLTASGISTNDEVWGVFHMNSLDSNNAPLIAEVWSYLEGFFSQAKGFNLDKLKWIYHRATWVNDLSGLKNDKFIPITQNYDIAFIANNEQSIYERLLELIPLKTIIELNIISPYFDDHGEAIGNIIDVFSPSSINVVTDSEFGLLPTKLSKDLRELVRFYDWKDCLEHFDKRFNRLHAKLYQFRFNDGSEYLMLGSANATTAAIGNANKQPINDEAGIIIRNKNGINYLNELGIDWQKAKSIDVTQFPRSKYNKGDNKNTTSKILRIIHAEINGHNLSITISKGLGVKGNLRLLNKFDEELEKISVEVSQNELTVETAFTEKVSSLYVESDGKIVSNKVIVHNVAILAKCNPDPNQQELNNIMTSLEDNPEGDQYIELLKYADYNWVESEIDEPTKTLISNKPGGKKQKEEIKHKKIDVEEFHALDSIQQIAQRILGDPTTQIADILQIVSRGLKNSKEDYSESEEEAIISQFEDDRKGEGNAVVTLANRTRGKQVEIAIKKHITKLYKHYDGRLELLKINKTFQDTTKSPLTVKDCSHISIALDLMYIFQGKYYSLYTTEFALLYSKNEDESIRKIEKKYNLNRINKTDLNYPNAILYEVNQELFKGMSDELKKEFPSLFLDQTEYSKIERIHNYIYDGIYDGKEVYGIKSSLIKILGSFIVSCNKKAGFKKYDYTTLNDKITSLREVIFDRATFMICNVHWRDKELVYRKLLLLNLLNFVYPYSELRPSQLLDRMNSQCEKSNKLNSDFQSNLSYYIDDVVKPYITWKAKYDGEKTNLLVLVNELRYGDIVYNMKIGFVSVIKYDNQSLDIITPGLDWNEHTKSSSLSINYLQNKIIGF